jgi:hypothetical protein
MKVMEFRSHLFLRRLVLCQGIATQFILDAWMKPYPLEEIELVLSAKGKVQIAWAIVQKSFKSGVVVMRTKVLLFPGRT